MLAVALSARCMVTFTGHQEGAWVGRQEGAMVRHQERGRMGHMKDVSVCGGHCVEGKIGGFLRCNLV